MGKDGVHIVDVLPSSIANELGIEKGDIILSINNEQISDILEYKYIICDEYLEIEVQKKDGEIWIYEVEKDYDEDLGLIFDGIIDEPKSCRNKCIFCFIDQLPKGMRRTLYFKDDDTRLSFLQGNFVTLTNLAEKDINKIIRYRISPINISVHTTNLELRKQMLNNKSADRLLEYIEKLRVGNIEMKAQIVLCPDINDGEELDRTINDLSKYYPELSCVAVVPVGLTKYREGLSELRDFDQTTAMKAVEQVRNIQMHFLKEMGTRFVFLSDEFFILSDMRLPEYEEYEEFQQLDNGVGLIALFNKTIEDSIALIDQVQYKVKKCTIATGEYAFPYIKNAIDMFKCKLKSIDISVIPIKNEFFGDKVKVAGLITGKDLINQLKSLKLGKYLLLCESMLKADEKIFLDDITISDIEQQLNVKIIICKEDGSDLIQNILDLN